jgi:riboflavin biosynthesis pyrimidine reductase
MRRFLPAPDDDVDPSRLYARLESVADGRPAVRANMIASADGAASVAGRSGALGGRVDQFVLVSLRAAADVVLVGSGTVSSEGYGPVRLAPSVVARRKALGQAPVPPIAVVTASCRLNWDAPFFTEAGQRPIVVTVAGADPDARRRAGGVADVVIAGEHQVDMGTAVRALGERGHSSVLAEGGPSVTGQLAAAGLLDELCLTFSPTLVGGDANRILRGPDIDPVTRLELVDLCEADGFLFARYRRKSGRAG